MIARPNVLILCFFIVINLLSSVKLPSKRRALCKFIRHVEYSVFLRAKRCLNASLYAAAIHMCCGMLCKLTQINFDLAKIKSIVKMISHFARVASVSILVFVRKQSHIGTSYIRARAKKYQNKNDNNNRAPTLPVTHNKAVYWCLVSNLPSSHRLSYSHVVLLLLLLYGPSETHK